MFKKHSGKRKEQLVDAGSFEFLIYQGEDKDAIHRRRNAAFIQVLIVLCLMAAAALLLWIPAVQYVHAKQEESAADEAESRLATWPQGKIAEEYHKAQAYNQRIAQSGQNTLGEFTDPFAPGASSKIPQSEKDTEYKSLLNTGGGNMGTIKIPKVSVHLPINHGTSDKALQHGVGHLYGTSLPVGGASTNAVLSGHRGLPDSLLFTRLDELKKGDIFYIQSLGRTMGYRVESIHVIDPDDTHLYKVVPGRDLVTLMTCTPYGVNTQRLIITGTRQAIPDPIPEPEDAKGDPMIAALIVAAGTLVLGLIWAKFRRLGFLISRHAQGGVPVLRSAWRKERKGQAGYLNHAGKRFFSRTTSRGHTVKAHAGAGEAPAHMEGSVAADTRIGAETTVEANHMSHADTGAKHGAGAHSASGTHGIGSHAGSRAHDKPKSHVARKMHGKPKKHGRTGQSHNRHAV